MNLEQFLEEEYVELVRLMPAEYVETVSCHDKKLINFVLDKVKEEVEKRKQEEKEAVPADEIEKIDERAYCAACDDISTIIDNIKIK